MAVTVSTVATEARRQTRTNSNTFTDADCLTRANDAQLDVARVLAVNSVQVTGVVAYTDLVANQSDYSLPDDCFEVVHAEINYDDPTDYTKWIKLQAADLPNLPVVWQQFIQNNPETKAIWDLFGGQIYTAPEPTTAEVAGLRLWYIQKPADYTASDLSDTIPWPFNLYWQALAYAMAAKFFAPIDDAEMTRCTQLFSSVMTDMVQGLSLENDEPVKSTLVDPYMSGWL